MNIGHEAMPAEVQAGLGRMEMDGIHFAPVRHHSPACALALQAMLRELRPAAVLVEGPDSFDTLLPLLLDARTRPPVAILSQAASTREGTPLKNLDAVMSTAEAVNVLHAAALQANFMGDGQVTPREMANGLQGVLIKDSVDDVKRVQHYFDTVVRERGRRDSAWKSFGDAARSLWA